MTSTEDSSMTGMPQQSGETAAALSAPIPDDPKNMALFLDIDGTLLEIAKRPELVLVSDDLLQCLGRLASHLDGALALITGRTLENADSLFEGLSLPVGAVHGMERRSYQGGVESTGSGDELAELRADLTRFVEQRPGLLLEDKSRTLALHYRAAPELETEIEALLDEHLSRTEGLTILHGKMVFEIKPEGTDKGAAIRAFMEEEPFMGRVPVFLGDDTTDEYGFAAVGRLGGYGIFVGGDKVSEAAYRLADVGAVHDWLAALLAKLEE